MEGYRWFHVVMMVLTSLNQLRDLLMWLPQIYWQGCPQVRVFPGNLYGWLVGIPMEIQFIWSVFYRFHSPMVPSLCKSTQGWPVDLAIGIPYRVQGHPFIWIRHGWSHAPIGRYPALPLIVPYHSAHPPVLLHCYPLPLHHCPLVLNFYFHTSVFPAHPPLFSHGFHPSYRNQCILYI